MWHMLALIAYSEALTCPTYSCGTSSSTTGQCQAYSTSTGVPSYTVTPCESGLLCPEMPSASSTCQNYPASTRYPGEYCQSNLDCKSNVCTGNVCQGLTSTSTSNCVTTADCEPGLYCSSQRCVDQVKIGSACTSNDMCTNNALCDNLVCVMMFSLAENEQTYTIDGYFAPLCMSGYAKNVSNVLTCSAAPTSASLAGPTVCPEDGVCSSSDGSASKSCECGYSGHAYCPLFEGDSYVQSMINSWQYLFYDSMNSCNGLSRYSYACFYAIGGTRYYNYLGWAINASLYFNGTWYKEVNAGDCIQNTFLQDYYNLIYDEQSLAGGYSKCPVYETAPSSSVMPAGQCVYYTKNIYSSTVKEIYQLGTCATGSCNSVMGQNSSCSVPTSLRYPGDYCTHSDQCYSGECSDKRCTGQGDNKPCGGNNLYCNPGYFCNSLSLCESVNNLPGCSADSQCNSTSTCVVGKCTWRYSLANGQRTSLTSGSTFGYSLGCQSGFAYKNSTTGYFYCTTAPVSPGTNLPSQCLYGSTCMDSTKTYENPCTCGFSGNGYCPLYIGDKNYFAETVFYFNQVAKKVSCYNNQLTSACVMHDSSLLYDFYQYYVNSQNMLNSAAYSQAADSVLEIFEQEYYIATEYISGGSSSSSSSSSSSFGSYIMAGSLGYLLLA